MDSALMRNTATSNFVCDLGTDLTPPQEYIPACRSAIYGFPILLYLTVLNERDANGDLVPSDKDPGERQLLGVYNFNLDKNSTDSLGLYSKGDIRDELSGPDLVDFDETYPSWDCMSFEGSANSDTTAGAFATIEDSSVYSDFEMRFDDIEDLLDEGEKTSLGEATVNGDIITISDINSDINGTYTIELPDKLVGSKHIITKNEANINSTLLGDYTVDYDFKYDGLVQKVKLNISQVENAYVVNTIESAESRIARRYGHLKKFIKWVKDSDIETFKSDFNKHCSLSSTIDYFLTVFVMLMADNLGKNCMWNTWGPVSNKKKQENPNKYIYSKQEIFEYDDYIWYPQFYDMDTCLGLDNSGNMRFDVHEEIEQGVFNTSNSVFWTKFRTAFASEIFDRYKELRTNPSTNENRKSAYTVEAFNKYFYTNQVSKISETNYNNNFKSKYLLHDDYLFMMHGRQYEYFTRWISQRLYFIDSYYEYGSDWGKESTVRVEYGDFAAHPVTFTIQTYQPSYVAVKFTAKTGNTKKLKVPRGATVTFQGYVDTATDQEVIIYMSPNIKVLGDLSPYSPKVVELSRMTKLTSLCVGSEENPNPNLSSISLGNNAYLTNLVAENCTALSGQIDVSNCTNLQYISTIGSTIPYVKFNANGGSLEEAHFSYATTTVNLNNFNLLKSITFENLEKLTTLQITNCPLITGYKNADDSIVPGYIMNILNIWEPTDKSTKITLDCYGNMPQYKFLDACSLLHEKYGISNRRIELTGDITYTGTVIPDRYSTYSSAIRDNNYFPDLHIHYPNVSDFSSMFANYKNINAIESQSVPIKDVFNNITYQLRYYWKDAKEEKFFNELNAEEAEVGVRKRPIQCYDDDDMKILADEIKDRMSPFSIATNMNEMFANDAVLEYIHPDTFDHMFIMNASTVSMFTGCSNLGYIEFPLIREIGPLAFNGCTKLLIYIPKETMDISDTAFLNNTYLYGVHPVFLFENTRDSYPDKIPYVRDARFNIARNPETGRALVSEIISCPNVIEYTENEIVKYRTDSIDVNMFYFNNSYTNKKVIYKVGPIEQDPLYFESWNCLSNLDGSINTFANPLNIGDVLYGAFNHISLPNLKRLAVPTYDITNLSPNTTPLYKEEISIAKMFYIGEMSSDSIQSLGGIESVSLLTEENHKISDYYLQDNTNIKNVKVQKYLSEIGMYSFANTSIESFNIEDVNNSVLTKIGMFAFANAKLSSIIIPNSVVDIGERAYEKNDNIGWLQYSENMEYVPIGCFSNCNTKNVVTENIFGFNPNKITTIYDYAFNNAKGLKIVGIDPDSTDKYNCYWRHDPSKTKFLDYFPKLSYIGNSAFLNITNIRKIKLNPVLKSIITGAFIPDKSEYGISTLLEWDMTDPEAYSNCYIYQNAFAGRQFDWYSNNFNGFTGIIKNTVFIPKEIGFVDTDAFSPESSMAITGGLSKLEFVITDAPSKPDLWSEDYAQCQTNTVYDFYSAYLHNDGESLYFLLNDKTCEYMKLLKNPSSLEFPATITNNNKSYTLTSIANNALCENDDLLNNIVFGYGSSIRKIGTNLFDSLSITNLSVEGDYTGRYIPESVVEIGEGTPFKNTNWFAVQLLDDFVYLNNVCIGYSPNTKTLLEALTVAENPVSIKDSIEVIYDNAFQNQNISSIALPSKLKRIGDYAFAGCINMTSINLLPCQENLTYIGNGAFKDDFSLKSLRYTKRLTHVGSGATSGCLLNTIIFDQGCSLDNVSEPFVANPDTAAGLDTTIRFLKISDSMGNFYSPSGVGYIQFSKLSYVTDLILGEYETYSLEEVPADELTQSEIDTDTTYYKLDLSKYYDTAYYTSYDGGVAISNPIVLHITENVFNKPLGTYSYDINISKFETNLLTQEDVIRIIMGYKNNETHIIYAKGDVVTKSSAAMYRNMFNNRVSMSLVKNNN